MDTAPTTPGRRRPLLVKMTDFRFALTSVVGKVKYAGDRCIVTSMGQPQVAIVSLEDLARLEDLDAQPQPEKVEARDMEHAPRNTAVEPQRAVA